MQYSVESLIKEVRVALDNNNSSEPLLQLGDIDTLTLNEIIESKLPNAARIVIQESPIHLLGHGEPISGKIYWPEGKIGNGWGHILLADDFLRLLCFQMSDWVMPVAEVINESDPRYAMQKSKYAGIKGNPQKPIVAIVPWGTGLHLEFYSCTAGSTIAVRKARYIPIPRKDNSHISFPEKLKPAIIYYAAFMTSQIIGNDAEVSKSLLEQSKELMK